MDQVLTIHCCPDSSPRLHLFVLSLSPVLTTGPTLLVLRSLLRISPDFE